VKPNRMRLRVILLVLALAASGCGSDGSGGESQQLPRDLGAELARKSDDVQRTLAAGDSCEAQRQALELRDSVERSIGRVPDELQDELRQRAADLVDSIECAPAPPPPPPPPAQTTQTQTDGDEEEEDD
jgi:hypothetical protein